ncbi:manganese catalase family protein [Anaerosporobacter sp.]
MWLYERRLQYPVSIRHPDKKLAEYIVECLNTAPYETKASYQYISQRYRSRYREINGLLTDIGTEAMINTKNNQRRIIQFCHKNMKKNM